MPVASSLEEWVQLSSQAVVPVRIERPTQERLLSSGPPGDSEFRASVDGLSLIPDVSVSRLVSDVCRIDRSDRLVRTDPADARMFFFHFSGSAVLDQDGRQAQVGHGEGSVAQAASAYRLDYQTRSDKAIIQLSPHLIDQAAYEAAALRTIRADQPSLVLLRSFTEQLLPLAGGMGPDQRETMGGVLADLVRATVHSTLEGRPVNPRGRHAMRQVIQADIRSRIADPALSPAELAARHHISLRYLHLVFTDAGATPATYIRERRLERAVRLLDDIANDHVTVMGVAYRCGFGDPTTFTRAFRRRFGCSPAEWRAARALPVG